MSSSVRILTAALLLAGSVAAQKTISVTEAVRLAFPGCEIQRERVAFPKGTRAAVVRCTATRNGKIQGAAYVDTRRVRSKAQQLLIVLDVRGKVRRIEVLAWKEPQRFRPKPAFYAQFVGKGVGDPLRLRRGIRPVTGATMSSRATVEAVRTVLTVHGRK